jgi:hypothetical protein
MAPQSISTAMHIGDLILRRLTATQTISAEEIASIDIDTFIAVADDQGIAAMLFRYLTKKDPLPAPFLNALRSRHEQTLLLRDYRRAELAELQTRLCRHGRVVLIQGMALDERVYPESMARPMGDIDLLLPDGTIREAHETLTAAGFTRLENYHNVWRRGNLQIDLHEDFWGADRVPARRLFAPDNEETFQPSVKLPGYLLPTDAMLALHAAFHAMKHGFSRRIWDCDLILLTEKVAPHDITAIDRHGVVMLAMQRLAALGLIDKPPGIVGGQGSSLRRRLVTRALPRAETTGSGEALLALTSGTWADTARYLWSTLMPPMRTLREMYGPHSGPQLIARRIGALCTAALRGQV